MYHYPFIEGTTECSANIEQPNLVKEMPRDASLSPNTHVRKPGRAPPDGSKRYRRDPVIKNAKTERLGCTSQY